MRSIGVNLASLIKELVEFCEEEFLGEQFVFKEFVENKNSFLDVDSFVVVE